MIRSVGLLLALVGAVGLGACSSLSHEGPGTSEHEMNPTDRLLVGRGDAYPADLTLRDRLPALASSQSERRAAAWQIAKRVLEPVKVDGGTRTLPRFQTWYAKEEFLPMFDRILRRTPKADLLARKRPTAEQIDEAFAWEAERAKNMADGTPEKLAERRAHLDENGDSALGGPERVLMSPELVGHLYAHYDSVLGCIGNVPAADSAPPSDTNFAPCIGEEMPPGAVIVKARWIPESIPLDAWDTDAKTLEATLTSGEWGTAPRTASPTADAIYTMTLPSGARMRLAALHIMTKELRDWAWVSLFWSDRPNADFGADRPSADFTGPFANYKMCAAVSFDEEDDGSSPRKSTFTDDSLLAAIDTTRAFGPRTWCSNPYLEEGAHNAKTNCIGCHQHGGTRLTTQSILEGEGAFPDGSRGLHRRNFPADYTFLTGTGLELGALMQAKYNQLAQP